MVCLGFSIKMPQKGGERKVRKEKKGGTRGTKITIGLFFEGEMDSYAYEFPIR